MSIRYILLAVMPCVLAVACSRHESDPERGLCPEGVLSGSGRVVVEYFVGGDGSETKAYGENLDASQRISSLKYLLYDESGALLKERDIPDIDTDTKWPLTRDNMTWAQREALKDTLYVSASYTAVFIANAADGLIEGKDVRDDLCLTLPADPFEDGNMFYTYVLPIPGTASPVSQGSLECPVRLHRIVSRTDITRVDPTVDYSTDDDAWNSYISPKVETLYNNTVEQEVKQRVDEVMEKFEESFTLQAIEDVLIPAYLSFASEISSDAVKDYIVSSMREELLSIYNNACVDNDRLRTAVRTWDGEDVSVALENLSNRWRVVAGEPFASGENTEVRGRAEGNSFTVIGFGDGTFNTLISLKFPESNLEIKAPSPGLCLWPGKNIRSTIECEPVAVVKINDVSEQDFLYEGLDLLSVFKTLEHWNDEFEPVIEKVCGQTGEAWSGVASSLTLTISIPSCSEDNISYEASFNNL